MCTVSFNVPNDFLASLSIDKEEASSYARLMFAVGVYAAGSIDAVRAAQIAGVTMHEFLSIASPIVSEDNLAGLVDLYESDPRYQPITEEELQKELMTARQAYKEGRHMDAMEFCAQMERRHA